MGVFNHPLRPSPKAISSFAASNNAAWYALSKFTAIPSFILAYTAPRAAALKGYPVSGFVRRTDMDSARATISRKKGSLAYTSFPFVKYSLHRRKFLLRVLLTSSLRSRIACSLCPRRYASTASRTSAGSNAPSCNPFTRSSRYSWLSSSERLSMALSDNFSLKDASAMAAASSPVLTVFQSTSLVPSLWMTHDIPVLSKPRFFAFCEKFSPGSRMMLAGTFAMLSTKCRIPAFSKAATPFFPISRCAARRMLSTVALSFPSSCALDGRALSADPSTPPSLANSPSTSEIIFSLPALFRRNDASDAAMDMVGCDTLPMRILIPPALTYALYPLPSLYTAMTISSKPGMAKRPAVLVPPSLVISSTFFAEGSIHEEADGAPSSPLSGAACSAGTSEGADPSACASFFRLLLSGFPVGCSGA